MAFSITLRACRKRRSRSAAVSCLAVITITGISRHSARAASGVEELETVHFRHHQVEQDHGRRRMLAKPGQCAAAVGGLGDRQAQFLDRVPHHLARIGIVLDDQDRTFAPDQAVDQRRQPRAVDRLGQDIDGAERKADAAVRSMVTMTTGMSQSSASALSALSTSQPSGLGIITSSVIASGRIVRARFRASAPLAA